MCCSEEMHFPSLDSVPFAQRRNEPGTLGNAGRDGSVSQQRSWGHFQQESGPSMENGLYQIFVQSRKVLHSWDDNGLVSLSVAAAMTQAGAGEGQEGERVLPAMAVLLTVLGLRTPKKTQGHCLGLLFSKGLRVWHRECCSWVAWTRHEHRACVAGQGWTRSCRSVRGSWPGLGQLGALHHCFPKP